MWLRTEDIPRLQVWLAQGKKLSDFMNSCELSSNGAHQWEPCSDKDCSCGRLVCTFCREELE
jgi:hypothetical protein